MIYYAETNLIAIVVGIILLIQMGKQSSGNETSKILMNGMLTLLIILGASDMAAYYFRGKSAVGVQAANILYFVAMAMGTYVWFGYIMVKTGKFDNMKKNRALLSSIPILILCLALLTNPITNVFFTVDENYLYHRGPGVPVTWVVEWGYMIAAIVINIRALMKESSGYRRREYRGYLTYAAPMTVAAICQMLFYGTTTVQVGYMIALLLVYLNQQYYQVQRDELTGLSNKNAFLSFQDSIGGRLSGSNLTLFMIDADSFKAINDTYGHLKGDRALQDIAEVLKEAAQNISHNRLMLFRYGGDEFLAVGRELEENEVQLFRDNLARKLEQMNEINRSRGESYHLALSVGLAARKCHNTADFDRLLKEADEAMYLVKQERKSRRASSTQEKN